MPIDRLPAAALVLAALAAGPYKGAAEATKDLARLSRLVGTELERWRRVIAESKIRAD